MTKPVATEDMANKLERDAKFIVGTNPERALEYTLVARRLRLLNALAHGVESDDRQLVEEARLALDADERGGKDGK